MIENKHRCWVKINDLQNNIGEITDVYPPNMVEVFDTEKKQFLIKKDTEIELISNHKIL